MTINITEPWYKDNNIAVFDTENNQTKLLYWACNHSIQGGECVYCALVIEGDE